MNTHSMDAYYTTFIREVTFVLLKIFRASKSLKFLPKPKKKITIPTAGRNMPRQNTSPAIKYNKDYQHEPERATRGGPDEQAGLDEETGIRIDGESSTDRTGWTRTDPGTGRHVQ